MTQRAPETSSSSLLVLQRGLPVGLRRALLAAVVGSVILVAPPAKATIVERIVAVIGDRAILLSDLRKRAQPFLRRIAAQVPTGAQRAAATSEVYTTLLDRMVDEELQRKAAIKANVNVSRKEIEDAVARIARQNGVEAQVLFDEAFKNGLSATQYRDEIRRQLIDAKLINIRIGGRIRVSDEDVRAAYDQLVLDELKQLTFRAAWIQVPATAAPGSAEAKQQRNTAESVAARARSGEDFAALARAYSTDPASREAGGLLPTLKLDQLAPSLSSVVARLGPGDVSAPVRVSNQMVIVKLIERQDSQLPGLEESFEELRNRVYMEKLDKARRHWLDSLRKRTHVEVRL